MRSKTYLLTLCAPLLIDLALKASRFRNSFFSASASSARIVGRASSLAEKLEGHSFFANATDPAKALFGILNPPFLLAVSAKPPTNINVGSG